MKKLSLAVILYLFISATLLAQGSAGTDADIESGSLIDMPTAGVLRRGDVGMNFYFMPMGVVISRIEAGVLENFSFGISYGASNLIGVGSPGWYKLPGVNVKFRILNESERSPSIAIGFDSQGKGEYFTRVDSSDVNRFKIKSPGFYAVLSKNYEFLGYISFHGAMNYSLEKDDRDKDIDLSVGVEKTIGPRLSMVVEYDFAINDNAKNSFGDGSGYLNAGLRWNIGNGLTLGLDLRDLLSNKKVNAGSADRAIRLDFVKPIFK